MISGIVGFVVAVGAVSAALFALMMRAENGSLRRARTRSGSSSDVGGGFDTDSSSVASWFGFSSSSHTADSACTGGSWDSGSGDGGSSDSGGGDCGGGGDGGGGGGD